MYGLAWGYIFCAAYGCLYILWAACGNPAVAIIFPARFRIFLISPNSKSWYITNKLLRMGLGSCSRGYSVNNNMKTGNIMTGWRLDKHIPVAVIIMLALQLSGMVWYASKFDSRMSDVEKLAAENSVTIKSHNEMMYQNNIRFANIDGSLTEIKHKLRIGRD